MFSALSLFSGCGGLDLGFERAGVHVVAAYDHWGPAIETYRRNFQQTTAIVASLSLSDGQIGLDGLPRCDIVLGGPPCQGFSFAGRQLIDDPRNRLYRDFVAIVAHTKPAAFLMENVRGLEAMGLDQVTESFETAGYSTVAVRALATQYAVPQRRERIMVVGFRRELRHRFVPPQASFGPLFGATSPPSVLEAIGDLPEPSLLGSQVAEPDGALASHVHRPLPPDVQKFVRHIPNGGSFRDAPRGLLPTRLTKILDDPQRYRSPRLFPKPDPNGPAQTVPADTNPSIGGVLAPDLIYETAGAKAVDARHFTDMCGLYTAPGPSRRFTPREAARLQTFPDDFWFTGSLVAQYQQIGNAVPVRMAEAFAEELVSQLSSVIDRVA